PGPENVPIPDPILPLAFAAAVTKKLRLATGILILPQRHPIYVAKEVATLDVLSDGRAILGIGIGWLKAEFDALGLPFAERAERGPGPSRPGRRAPSPGPGRVAHHDGAARVRQRGRHARPARLRRACDREAVRGGMEALRTPDDRFARLPGYAFAPHYVE